MSYRRYNILQDKWVLTSAHRFNRPWSGQMENGGEQPMPQYDADCYLCPGNKRSTGQINPNYTSTYFFVNDFSALILNSDDSAQAKPASAGFFQQHNEKGVCEVVCYCPEHNKTMSSMTGEEIRNVIQIWKQRYCTLGADKNINHIQIFENHGNEVGNSNLHPHGQIWTQSHVPTLPATELKQQQGYFKKTGARLLLDYAREELAKRERIIFINDDFVVLVPFWTEWPYETLILPLFPLTGLDDLSESKFPNLAKALSVITKTYGKLFQRQRYGAPYTMGIHQKPTNGKSYNCQLHFHFQPPLLTPNRQKFMVGYERFAEAQRDLTTEQAAKQLKDIAHNI